MPIEDVGYRGWSGRRLNSLFSWLIMVWSGVLIARRSVWVRRALIVAWIPLVYLGSGMFFFENIIARKDWDEISEIQEMFFVQAGNRISSLPVEHLSEDVRTDGIAAVRHRMWSWMLATFLSYPQSLCSLLLIGLLAPPLISRDIRSKAFLIYFSKPIGRLEYLSGKISILALFLAFITFVPALGLYVFGVFLSPNLSVIWDTWDLPFRVGLASLVFILPTAAIALMFSSLTTESRYAAFAWFAFWGLGFTAWQVIRLSLTEVYWRQLRNGQPGPSLAGPPLRNHPGEMEAIDSFQQVISQDADRWAMASQMANQSNWSLLSLYDSLVRLQAWVLGYNEQMTFPWVHGTMVGLLTLFALAVLLRRVSAPIRV